MRLPPNFTEKTSKTSVSCEASDKFHRRRFHNDSFRARLHRKFHTRRFQNERFARGFLQISQKKLPKRAFRAKLPTIFTEGGSKMIVSCEASSKFHKRRFQNERFARGFLEISQNKLPKRAFCAMLPTISQKKLPKGSFRAMLRTIFTEKTSERTESLKWKKIHQKNGKKIPRKVLDPPVQKGGTRGTQGFIPILR